jgi:hypothetical protein
MAVANSASDEQMSDRHCISIVWLGCIYTIIWMFLLKPSRSLDVFGYIAKKYFKCVDLNYRMAIL